MQAHAVNKDEIFSELENIYGIEIDLDNINKSHRHHNIQEYICQCGYRSNDDSVGAMNIQLLTLWISGEERPHFEKITTSD